MDLCDLYVEILSDALFSRCRLLISSETGFTSSVSEQPVCRVNELVNVRSSQRFHMEKRQATAGERKAASSAILAAAAVKQEKDQVVIWSQENFDRHLEKLTIDEVKVLLELVLTQKKQSVFLYEPNIGAAQFRQTGFNFKTNQGRVISRLLAILAE